MLLVVFGCGLLYWAVQGRSDSLTWFNQVGMIAIGVGVLLFIGCRPINGAFVDMTAYARTYEHIQRGAEASLGDGLFDTLMRLSAPVLPAEGFFFVCAVIYIGPLAIASWRVHGIWAFPVFLAFLTAFSFWGYGVNGIRNGMATSVMILAFAFGDKPVIMFPLMAAAWGFHGSLLLPAAAFLTVRYIKRTEIWLGFWGLCVALTFIAGNIGEMLLSHFNPFAWDNRVDSYIVNSGDAGGFRADFLAYSIIPVVVTLLLAAPTRARRRRLVDRVMNGSSVTWMRKRTTMAANRMWGGRPSALQGASPMGSVALAGVATRPHEPRNALGSERSTLNKLRSGATSRLVGKPSARQHPRPSTGRSHSERQPKAMQTAWDRLPWVRMLRSDPFYARLVNTYLLTNGVWVLLIHANFSNRFAYLSWFMMPWVLLYPFVPGKTLHRPRTGLIAATLGAQYLFTYAMGAIIDPLRGAH